MKWVELFYHRDGYAETRSALKEKPAVKAATQLAPILGALTTQPVVGGLFFPVPDQVLHQMQREFVLSPEEKVKATRDAMQSWGHLKNPPPSAQKAGPRPDALIGDHP